MTAGGPALPHGRREEDPGDGDVLRRLRSGTASAHEAVDRSLDLLDPQLTPARLAGVLTRMHGFWQAAEAGLDAWAAARPADAVPLQWGRRRRAHLFAADLATLGAAPPRTPDQPELPELPALPGTEEALGRLYVLEGSTLGGAWIDRHLAGLPQLSGTRLRAFSPYGAQTGAMWHGFRSATRAHVAAGGDAGRVVAAAQQTFTAFAGWCARPAEARLSGR